MTTIEKIKAEIERLKGYYRITNPYDKRAIRVCEKLISFLSTIEEEPVIDDLEEAADNHIREVVDASGHPGWDWETRDIKDAFIAGANWQKEQDDRLVDIIYQQGIEKGKDEMKEQAVSGTLAYEPHLRRIIVNLDDIPDGAWSGGGTPVEVIIFKNEQVTKEN